MYPVWWEDERFYRYLRSATAAPGIVPLGRLGLYKYVTIDTTYEHGPAHGRRSSSATSPATATTGSR